MVVAGAPFLVGFSNRRFPTKAVAIWRALDTNGHAALIRLYLERAGFAEIAIDVLADGRTSDPLVAVTGRAPSGHTHLDWQSGMNGCLVRGSALSRVNVRIGSGRRGE